MAVKVIKLETLNTSIDDIYVRSAASMFPSFHGVTVLPCCVHPAQMEVKTMRMCRNEHVLPLCASFVVDYDLWLITPLMDKGARRCSRCAVMSLWPLPFIRVRTRRFRVLRAADAQAPASYTGIRGF